MQTDGQAGAGGKDAGTPGDVVTVDASCVVSNSDGGGAERADAGMLPSWTSPGCCEMPAHELDSGAQSLPVSFSVAHGIAPRPDGGVTSYAVPDDGYAVTLSPRLSTIPAGATLTNATFSVVDITRGIAYPNYSTSTIYNAVNVIGYQGIEPALQAGSFAITYELSGSFAVDASASTSSFTSRGFQLASICGGGTVDTVLPHIPPLTLVHVTIDQLQNGLPASGIVSLTLTTLDRTFSAQASTTVVDPGAPSVVVSIQAPLRVPLVPEIAGAGEAPTTTLTGDAIVSMPPQVRGYGTITVSDAINPTESSVVCTVPSPAPSPTAPFPPTGQTFSGAVTGAASPYLYSILVPRGVSCVLSARLAIDVADGFPAFLASPTVIFDGSVAMRNFTLPPLAGQVTFYVTPTYVRGGNEASGSEHFRGVSTSLDGSFSGWSYSKDFNHLQWAMDWGILLPGTYDLFESEPILLAP